MTSSFSVDDLIIKRLTIDGQRIQQLDLGALVVSNPTYGVGIGTDTPRLRLDISGTNGIRIPVGITGERPQIGVNGIVDLSGVLRYNTTLNQYEAWALDGWQALGGSSLQLYTKEQGTNPTIKLTKEITTYGGNNDGGIIEFCLKNQSNSVTYQARISALDSTSNAGYGSLVFSTSGGGNPQERMRIDHTGNVDISDNLTVGGDISGNDASFNDVSGVNFFGGNFFGNLQGNAATTTQLANARNIGGVSFNGTANIDLPGVNVSGNQNTSGNAATTTQLANARNIGGVSFNGTTNIDLPGVNVSGNQNTSGNAATADKIASITNSNIVQLTETQTLTNKTLTSPTITGTAHISSELNINSASSGLYFNFDQVRRIGTGNLYIQLGSGRGNTILNLDSGNVGIGTNSPSYPLEIYGSYNGAFNHGQSVTLYGVSLPYYNSTHTWSGTWFTNLHGYPTISLKTHNGIYCGGQLFITSDERIKTNIQDVSDNVALQQLRDISCCFYEYKDKVIKGTEKTIGFIAQQVREHMPMAVSIQKGIIPNEMRKIENPQWTTVTDASGNNTYKLTIPDLEDASGNTSETTKYRFYVSNDPSGNDECEKEITSLENEPKSFIFEEQWQNVFLYGKEIDDFHTLDKQKLFALNFSATQEIDRIQQQEKTKIEEQTSKLEEQTSKLAEAQAEIASLKTTLVDVLSRLAALEGN